MRRMASEVEDSLLVALDVVRKLTYEEIYSRMTESTVPEVCEEVPRQGSGSDPTGPQDGETPPMGTYKEGI